MLNMKSLINTPIGVTTKTAKVVKLMNELFFLMWGLKLNRGWYSQNKYQCLEESLAESIDGSRIFREKEGHQNSIFGKINSQIGQKIA